MQVKFHRIDRLYEAHKKQIQGIVHKVYSSGQVLKGEAVGRLERKIAEMTNRKYAVAVGSCSDALSLVLMTIGAEFENKVVVTPFTFDASKTCIHRNHSSPIYTLVEDDYFMMDLENLYELLKQKPYALIAVNLFGQMLNMRVVEKMCDDCGVHLIEDAAQSFTSSYDGRPAGSFGSMSCLSFDPTKIVPAFATGGMVLTNEECLADIVRHYHYKNFGTNSQLSTLQAEIIFYWLKFIHGWEERRLQIASRYLEELYNIKEIGLPKVYPKSKHIWHKFVIKAEKRDKLKDYLLKQGIETKIHYRPHKKVLSLPIYPHLTNEEIDWVAECIRKFYL